MRFNVAQLLRQPIGATRRYEIDEPAEIADDQINLVGPIRGTVTLLRTQRGILATAHLKQAVRVQCARCLDDIETPLELTVEEEFFPSIDLKTGLPIHWSEEDEVDEAVMIDDRHNLDLREIVRQEIHVSLPARPLCRDDCPGICLYCGANRKVEPCQCQSEGIDPRWMALASLTKSDKARSPNRRDTMKEKGL